MNEKYTDSHMDKGKSEMIYVIYYWTEDGEGERCRLEYVTTDKEVRCEHCDRMIPQGTPIARLFPRTGVIYYLHENCAEKGCHFYPGDRVRHNKHLTDYIAENKE